MLEKIPTDTELKKLLGVKKYNDWMAIRSLIDGLYEMDAAWNRGYKSWKYEYKYRRGGKTLCALSAKEDCFGLMFVFGAAERKKFEAAEKTYSAAIRDIYKKSTTYHDGKWMMVENPGRPLLADIGKLLQIKRKPNRKNPEV
ncbi:MAG: DUF3788 domain-containing protein [Proteobacteria bacterium]|nr:DUF3788 domain-containing protein [Pseudomonadota bacterium]